MYDRGVSLRQFVRKLGPGLITGASDDDPAGIATYTIAGASLGYQTLWTVVLTIPLMIAVQYVCARIGMVCGVGLSGALRRRYPRWLLAIVCVVLLVANVFNISADLRAMAEAAELLTGIPSVPLVILFGLVVVLFTVYASYETFARYVKWATLVLVAYLGAALLARPQWTSALHRTLVPPLRLESAYLTTIVALLGTTISPYLFFWQASQEVEAEKALGRRTRRARRGATAAEMKDARNDVITGMLLSNLVAYAIIVTAAATLFRAGRTDVQTTGQAAEALRPLAGSIAYLLFDVGLIGSGLLAIPVLAGSASFAIAELQGWRAGLNERPGRAKRFYGVFAAAIGIGVALDLVSASPMKMLFYSAILNGLIAPPLLAIVMLVANSEAVMGEWTNTRALNVLGWGATALMAAAAVAMMVAGG